jgi:pimeloyl-ACP methyl ester carboxylesterase
LVRRWDTTGAWRIHSITTAHDTQATPPLERAVLLIHGLGMSSRYLRPTLRELGKDHAVYAPDVPGAGHSTRPRHPLRLHETADAVAAWMDAVGLVRPVVVGHSVGCQVVAHLAERHPDRVHSLVLASPTGDPTTNRWWQASSLARDAFRERPSLIPVAVGDYLRAGPVRMWRTFRRSRRDDLVARLHRLQVPTVVVRGGRDVVVSAEWARLVADAVRTDLVTIEGAPHGLPYSAPAPFARTVGRFARS